MPNIRVYQLALPILFLSLTSGAQVNHPSCSETNGFGREGACYNACLLCDLHDVVGTTGEVESSRIVSGCAASSFNIYAFVAQSEELTLDVTVNECSQDQGGTDTYGLIFYVFKVDPFCTENFHDGDYAAVTPCSGHGGARENQEEFIRSGTTKRFTVTEALEIGKIYYVGLGYQADAVTCGYDFTVVEGNTDFTNATPELNFLPENPYCLNTPYSWSLRNPTPGVEYAMTLGDTVVKGTTLEYLFRETSEYELCVSANYPCTGLKQTCYTLRTTTPTVMDTTVTVCPGECYTAANDSSYCEPGQYQFLVENQNDCSNTIQLSVVQYPLDTTLLIANICGGDILYYQGVGYFEPGTYQSSFIGQNGCDSLVNLNVNITNCPLEGSLTGDNPSCHDDSNGSLSFQVYNGIPPYEYHYAKLEGGAGGNGTISTRNSLTRIEGLPTGTYLLEITDAIGSVGYFNAELIIPDPLQVEIQVSDYNGSSVSCPNGEDGSIAIMTNGGVAPYTYDWGNNTPSTNERFNLEPGSYPIRVIDANGCVYNDSAILDSPSPLTVVTKDIVPEECNYPGSGRLADIEIEGGVGNFKYQLFFRNSSEIIPTTQYDSLRSGDYELQIQDANGCIITDSFSVLKPIQANIDLYTATPVISLGENAQIEAVVNNEIDFFWNDPNLVECESCFRTVALPTRTTVFRATAISTDGCEATDSLSIRVLSERKTFLPSAFSPNDDGINDILRPFLGKSVSRIISISVYDRWGGLLTRLENETANVGWDGTTKGQLAPTGTYVWFVEIEHVDGVVELLKNTVTLVR